MGENSPSSLWKEKFLCKHNARYVTVVLSTLEVSHHVKHHVARVGRAPDTAHVRGTERTLGRRALRDPYSFTNS